MKTIEEKAKRYDEAIKVAKSKINNDKDHVLYENDITDIFPELAESEDERIRKNLIELLLDTPSQDIISHHLGLNEVLAWLEKQGKNGANGNDRKIPFDAWSEEDEKQARQIERIVHDDGCTQKLQKQIADWLKSLKDRIQPQPKQEWSEDDEVALKDVCDWLDRLSMTFVGNESIVCQEEIKWLKSLKDRIQPKVELTQLDKNILEAAIAFVAQNDHFNCWRGVDKHTVLSALHSLRPKKQWKPSKEQMDALNDVISSRDIKYDVLSELWKDLKKLREE